MKRRKKLFSILSMVLAFALLLTGCTTGGNGTTTAATTVATTSFSPSSIEEDASLSIYIYTGGYNECYLSDVYDFYAGYKNLIDMTITEFDDAEEMESRLQLELAAGQGPDVILAEWSFGLDMMSLAKNGAFYDMTDIIAADDSFNEEKYYLSVMEAGQLDDRQYVIPLSFTLPTFISTKTALKDMGINLETDTTIEIYEKMLAHLKESDTPQVSNNGGVPDSMMTMLQSCGKAPVSYETGESFLDGEETKMIMEFGAELFKDANAWMRENMNSPATHFVSESAKVPLSYINYFTSPLILQTFYSGRVAENENDEVVLHFASDEDGNYHALVQEFAAVSANAKNPELAWMFLKEIIDHKLEQQYYSALSLNRSITNSSVRQAMATGYVANDGLVLEKLPQELGDQILNACDKIGNVNLSQYTKLAEIFREGERAYRDGTIDMDTMIEDIRNKVKLYINE